MRGFPGAPGSYPGAVEVEEVGRIAGLLPGVAGTIQGVSGDDG